MANAKFPQAVSYLLQNDRLLGEVIVNLPRKYVSQRQSALVLKWSQDLLTLEIDEEQLDKLRIDELVSQLAHDAYHIIWEHPIRYAHSKHPHLATIACDMAVNEYLKEAPADSWTRSEVEKITRTAFEAQAGSASYLRELLALSLEKRQELARHFKAKAGHQHTEATPRWINAPAGNDIKRKAQIRRLTHQAYQSLTQHQRGLLPASLNSYLKKSDEQFALPPQAAIWRLMGQVPSGYEPSRARFNRRQPWRMDLMGKITRFKSRLYVFVDNSGSMGDEDIGRVLDLCQRLAGRVDTEITVISFDAAIQGPAQHIQAGKPIKYVRFGGGGTSFQVIFDWLADHHLPLTVPIVILTDGWGETRINQAGYHNVLWLLTTDSALSLKQVHGQVVHLRKLRK